MVNKFTKLFNLKISLIIINNSNNNKYLQKLTLLKFN